MNILEKYINNSKIKVVEKFDLDKREIEYTSKLKGRNIKVLTPEEKTRAFLLTKLANELGYNVDNIEIETEYPIGRKNSSNRIDLIIRDDQGKAFLFVEIKEPNEFERLQEESIEKQLFNLAPIENAKTGVKYIAYYTYELTDTTIKDKVIIIDYEKFHSYDEWKNIREYSDEIPVNYGVAYKEPYKKGSDKDLEKDFTHEQIDGIRTNLHNVLWGGGGTDDNEVFSSLVNIILAKIQDESEKRDGEQYEFQILVDKNNHEIEKDEELFDRINGLYQRALVQRMNLSNVSDSKVIDINKFSLSKLKYAIQTLESYSFVDGKNSFTGKDILGDFFEGIIREGFKQSKGQFFTHINIVKFLLWGLQIDKLAIRRVNNDGEIPYMIDPSSGSGTFLIEYMKFITENLKRRFRSELATSRDVEDKFYQWFMPDHRENKWAKDYIYGSDINFNLGTATKVNMILHGDGSTNIFVGSPNGDGLLPFTEYKSEKAPNILNNSKNDPTYNGKKINGAFDVIITNPPFSVDLDKDTKRKLKDGFLFPEKKNSENLFIERYYQLLRENGRLGVVLPESVFDTTENKYIRLFIYKYFKIKAIVSLPQVTFEPYTPTKTSLLFAQKKTKEEVEKWDEIWNKYKKEWSYLKTRVTKELELNILNDEISKNYLILEKDELYKTISKCYALTEEDMSSLRDNKVDDISAFLKSLTINKSWSISKEDEQTRKSNVLRLLGLNNVDDTLSVDELVTKYRDELSDLISIDKDTAEIFGHVNTGWVFQNVSKELDYSIFMAEVDNVGYKRTKRGERIMPNDLYDLEIAPDEIKKDEVIAPILNGLKFIEELLNKKSNLNAQKAKDEVKRLNDEKIKLENDLKNTSTLIDNLYLNGKLKENYIARIQQKELEDIFSNKYLAPFKSTNVVLRNQECLKVLDYLRGVEWD